MIVQVVDVYVFVSEKGQGRTHTKTRIGQDYVSQHMWSHTTLRLLYP